MYGAGGQTGLSIIDNTIAGCSGYGIYMGSNTLGAITVSSNNLENNSLYNLYWGRTDNLNATYNYWGTTDSSAIGKSIYDFNDDFGLGTVTYAPYLTSFNTQAPALPTPTPNPSPTPTPAISGSPNPTSLSTSTPILTPSPTPTSTHAVPELSWLVIVPLLLTMFAVAVIFWHRKTAILNQSTFSQAWAYPPAL